jgi:hypothetical protein
MHMHLHICCVLLCCRSVVHIQVVDAAYALVNTFVAVMCVIHQQVQQAAENETISQSASKCAQTATKRTKQAILRVAQCVQDI